VIAYNYTLNTSLDISAQSISQWHCDWYAMGSLNIHVDHLTCIDMSGLPQSIFHLLPSRFLSHDRSRHGGVLLVQAQTLYLETACLPT